MGHLDPNAGLPGYYPDATYGKTGSIENDGGYAWQNAVDLITQQDTEGLFTDAEIKFEALSRIIRDIQNSGASQQEQAEAVAGILRESGYSTDAVAQVTGIPKDEIVAVLNQNGFDVSGNPVQTDTPQADGGISPGGSPIPSFPLPGASTSPPGAVFDPNSPQTGPFPGTGDGTIPNVPPSNPTQGPQQPNDPSIWRDLLPLIAGGLGGYFQNRAIDDAARDLTGAGNQAIEGITTALGDYQTAVEPYGEAGAAALPGLTGMTDSPFTFNAPDLSREQGLIEQGRSTMSGVLNQGTKGLPGLPGYDVNLEGLIDPLNYESAPYQQIQSEGVRAVQDAMIFGGRGESGETMKELMRFGTGLKQNQIGTAMGLRDQQLNERMNISGQRFGQASQSRGQLFGERGQMFDMGQALSGQAFGQGRDTFNTLFDQQRQQNQQRFGQLFDVARLGANAVTGAGTTAINTASKVGGILTNMGNVNAASGIAQSNIWTGLVGDIFTQLGINNPFATA